MSRWLGSSLPASSCSQCQSLAKKLLRRHNKGGTARDRISASPPPSISKSKEIKNQAPTIFYEHGAGRLACTSDSYMVSATEGACTLQHQKVPFTEDGPHSTRPCLPRGSGGVGSCGDSIKRCLLSIWSRLLIALKATILLSFVNNSGSKCSMICLSF
jgi:hypothetical protein